MTFTTHRERCPSVTLNGQSIPQAEDAKYLGLHLDRRLNWRKHIYQAKTTWTSTGENVLATQQQITIDD
jgi:hypothetical protein